MTSKSATQNNLALVLSGGGARGAYEAGVIHYLRTQLPKRARNQTFSIQCGSSVGAINTCFMAATAEDLSYQGSQILKLWQDLRAGDIFSRDLIAFSWFLTKSMTGIFYNLFRRGFFKTRHSSSLHFSSLFDTKPFGSYLKKIIPWSNLHRNVRNRIVRDVALVATRMRTGQTEIFLQNGSGHIKGDKFIVHSVDLNAEHAMASSAIPIVFPNILIDNHYYLDGSLRLNTPLSPAIYLGANKILTINLLSRDQKIAEHPCSEVECPPGLGEYFGKFLNAFFLDPLNYDLHQVEKINGLIEAGKKVYGADFLERINEELTFRHSLKQIQVLEISPSVSLSSVFSDWYAQDTKISLRLSLLEKFFMKILDVDPTLSMDLLSYLIFDKNYLARIIDLGFEDAKQHHDRLVEFLDV